MSKMLLRSIYAKRALANPHIFKLAAARALSSASVTKPNPHGWKSWRDIPDSALPKCPDPTNGIYETEEYKRVQKKQIWYQIDNSPTYFKDGIKDKIMVYTYVGMVFSLLAYEYYIIATQVSV